MAAVIRAARLEPGHVVLATRPPPGACADSAPAGPTQVAAFGAARAEAPGAASAIPAPPDAIGTPALPDGLGEDARAAAGRDALEAERRAVLERARAEGFEQGRREAGASFEQRLQSLDAVLASARAALAGEIAGAEDVIVEIAFEAVGRILGEAMSRREGALAAVREVVRGVHERERLRVRVAPADLELLRQHGARLVDGSPAGGVDLVADERVALGGCFVETAGGTIDARLETQVARLAETLAAARRQRGDAPS